MRNYDSKKGILIIEDDEQVRFLLKDFIEEKGYVIDSADNGSEALEILERKPFDLVITDIQIPGLRGLDILPHLKKYQPDVSIIVISAFGGKKACLRAFERGATAYIKKPIDLQALKTLIQDLTPPGKICSNITQNP